MNFSKTYTTVGTKDIVRVSPPETSFSIGVNIIITGIISIDVRYTPDKPDMEVNTPPGGTYDNWSGSTFEQDPALTAITATTTVHVDTPVEALQIVVNSVTGGSAKIVIIQGDKA